MTKPTRGPWLLALALVGLVQAVAAQCDPCGVTILQLTTGARPLGLGGAFVSGSGPTVLFYNPAQVGSVHGSVGNIESVGGAMFGSFATSGSIGPFGVGAGTRFLAGTAGAVGDSTHVARGGLTVGAAIAANVRGVWLGGAASYVTPDLGRSGSTATFDAGAAIRSFGLRLGVAVQNLGRDFDVAGVPQELPRRVVIGATLPSTPISTYLDLSASAAVARERDGAIVPQGGLELGFEPVSGWTFTGRIGVRRVVVAPGLPRQSAVTLGASFELDRIGLDYAFRPAVDGGPPVHSFSLRIE